jgi:hypothetical protein
MTGAGVGRGGPSRRDRASSTTPAHSRAFFPPACGSFFFEEV